MTDMDDIETLHRRARLRELIAHCFDGKTAKLLRHIESRTGKAPNQGELSAIQRDNSGKSFADKKAKTLTMQIGLHRRWFELPLGSQLERSEWGTYNTTDAAFIEEAPAKYDLAVQESDADRLAQRIIHLYHSKSIKPAALKVISDMVEQLASNTTIDTAPPNAKGLTPNLDALHAKAKENEPPTAGQN